MKKPLLKNLIALIVLGLFLFKVQIQRMYQVKKWLTSTAKEVIGFHRIFSVVKTVCEYVMMLAHPCDGMTYGMSPSMAYVTNI